MNDPRQRHEEPLDSNVRRLLLKRYPLISMPESDKRQVLEALVATRTAPATPVAQLAVMLARPRSRLAFTAAGLALVAALVVQLWPWPSAVGPAWAEIARRFQRARSVTAWITTEARGPDGNLRIERGRFLHREPGRTRLEGFGVRTGGRPWPVTSAEEPVLIDIERTDALESAKLSLRLDDHTIDRQFVRYEGTLAGPTDEHPIGTYLGSLWSRFRQAIRGPARVLGRRDVEGVATVGYETSIAALAPFPGVPSGTLRVWVSDTDTLPRLVEMEIPDPNGGRWIARVEGFEWDPDLPDRIFEIADTAGFRVNEIHRLEHGFARRRFRQGVRLGIGLPGGAPVITAKDVAKVGPGVSQHWNSLLRPTNLSAAVQLELTPEAMKRFRGFCEKHPRQEIEISFEGRVLARTVPMEANLPRLSLPVDSLGMTFPEFENRFLGE